MSDMATMAMPVSLDGPLPLAPAYSLLNTIEAVPDDDVHWINGAQIWGYPPGLPSVIEGCAVGSDRVKDEAVAAENPTFGAITTYLPFQCTKRSFRDYDEIMRRVQIAFDARLSFAAEKLLVEGTETGLNPHLTDVDVSLPFGSTAFSPAEGLALIEDIIGESGSQGVIHANPGAVTAWTNTLVEKVGGKLRSIVGNLIVSGGGYIDSFPINGDAPSDEQQSWVYVTGPLQYRASAPFIPADTLEWALDRSDNTVVLYAERYLLVDWDAELHAAVLIDRSIS